MSQTLLASVGDANDIRTYSGIPYHILQEARRAGVIDDGLPLTTQGWRWAIRRYTWNLRAMVSDTRLGGYQYSDSFLEELWAPHRSRLSGCRLINCFPLYPPSLIGDPSVEFWYYLDQTLLQLFDSYGVRAQIGQQIAHDALELERKGYENAAGIMMNSHWAAESVIRDYGISPRKVFVVVQGANLDPGVYERWASGRPGPSVGRKEPLRLVFVGKEPQRKGLDRLLRAFKYARSAGANCTLRVIGCRQRDLPEAFPPSPDIEWIGFIDKRRDAGAYLKAVADCDIGCLLSRAEAGGIGLREYHALGLAVIGPNVGGAPDQVIREAASLVDADASDESIAKLLLALDANRALVQRMRAVSWARRREVTWKPAVLRMNELLGPSR